MLLATLMTFMIGSMLGSFITCMAERLCLNLPLWSLSRSACPTCHHQLRWWQLIPILGILIQRGRCWDCHAVINWRSTLIELIAGVLTMAVGVNPSPNLLLLLFCYIILLFNSLTDYLTLNIYPATIIGPLLLGWWLQPPTWDGPFYLVIILIISLYLIAKFTNRLGSGDIDILLMLSAVASPALVIGSLTLAAIAALVILILRRKRAPIPFVPFMTWSFILCTQLNQTGISVF